MGEVAAGEPAEVLGVGLDRYAGVAAALAEGIALTEVLAQEQIDTAEWPRVDRAWKETLVAAPELQLRYMKLRRQAEDCLGRTVTPLDEDPAAWAGFLGMVALADDPDRAMRALGLRATDVARIGRAWSRKAAADPAVAERLTSLAGKAPPVQEVRCGPTALRPFPWTRPREGGDVRGPSAEVDANPVDAAAEATQPVQVQVPTYLAATTAPKPALPAGSASVSGTLAPDSRAPRASPLPFPAVAAPGRGPREAARTARSAPVAKPRVSTGTLSNTPLQPPPAPAGEPTPAPTATPPSPKPAATAPAPSYDPASGPVIGGLTLAQYASLSVELSVEPARAPAILAAYRIAGEPQRRTVFDAWNELLSRDAALAAVFAQRKAEFHAWLVQQKRTR